MRQRSLARNFALLFSSNVIGQLLYLAGTVHLARAFTIATFGIWSLAQAWLLYLFRAGELGLEVVAIRSIASEGTAATRSILWHVVVIRGLQACLLLGAVVLLAAAGVFPEGSSRVIVILALALIPSGLILEWVFEAHQRVGPVGASRIIKGAVFAALVVAFVRADEDLDFSAIAYVAGLGAASLAVGIVAAVAYAPWPAEFRFKEAKRMLSSSLPIFAASMFWQYALFVGTILGGYFLLATDLGVYTAGHRLVVFMWAYGIGAAHRIMLPRLTGLAMQSPADYGDSIVRIARVLAIGGALVLIPALAAGGDIVQLLYGPRYAAAGPVLSVLTVALVLALLRSVLEVGFLADGRQRTYLAGMAALAGVYTVGSLIALREGSIIGLAIAAVVAEAGCALVALFIFRSVRASTLVRAQVPPLLVAVLVVVALNLLGLTTVLPVVLIGTGLYACILLVTGIVRLSELRQYATAILGPR